VKDLWAISCYFNPVGYRRRLENFLTFRRQLAVPLVAVELAYHEDFELPSDAAEILIRLRANDVLWQKERLLNVALAHLPSDCDAVAWLDCDVVFERQDWAQLALRALQRYPMLQPFRHVYEPAPDEFDEAGRLPSDTRLGYSQAHMLSLGTAIPMLLSGNMRFKHGSNSGLAWVARRELLDRHGFYDACVMGSGDRAMLCAALGEWDNMVAYLRMTPAWAEHYQAWAAGHFRSVRADVGCIDGAVTHLWHGNLKHRRYLERHREFSRFAYNPATDIALDENGCWRWNSQKPEMHAYVAEYFRMRAEDGERFGATPAGLTEGESRQVMP
jgi:hypothetical protein